MKLLSTLVAGVRGAENGFATVRVRGTTVAAQCFSAFEGGILAQPAGGFALDAFGGVEVYVNGLVDVEVKDSGGTTVRAFTEGDSAAADELISPSFTGTDYQTSISAPSLPTTVKAALDKLVVSAGGATDFNVASRYAGGSINRSLASISAATSGLFYSVTDPQFGAVGDGSVDDTSAIQAACNAAGTAGGIVVFPEGLWRTTGAVAVPQGVQLLGVGMGKTIILLDSATGNAFTFAGLAPNVFTQYVQDMSFEAYQAHSGNLVSIGSFGRVHFLRCSFNSFVSLSTGSVLKYIVGEATLENCKLSALSTNAAVDAVYTGAGNLFLTLRGCIISAPDATGVHATNVVADGCRITANTCFDVDGGGAAVSVFASLVGNQLTSGNTPVSAFKMTNGGNAGSCFYEDGNSSNFSTMYTNVAAGANNPQVKANTRDCRIQNLTDNTATITLKADQYGVIYLTRTSAGNQTLNINPGPPGAFFTLVVLNSSGGVSGTFTTGTGFQPGTASFTAITNAKTEIYQFRMSVNAGTGAWSPVAASNHNI